MRNKPHTGISLYDKDAVAKGDAGRVRANQAGNIGDLSVTGTASSGGLSTINRAWRAYCVLTCINSSGGLDDRCLRADNRAT